MDLQNNDKLGRIAEGLKAIYSIKEKYKNSVAEQRDDTQPRNISVASDILQLLDEFGKVGVANMGIALEKASRLSSAYKNLKRCYVTRANRRSSALIASDAPMRLPAGGQTVDARTEAPQNAAPAPVGVRETLNYLQPALSSRSSLIVEKTKKILDIIKT
jgi:hypothetical protein